MKHGVITIVLPWFSITCFAANPASTNYVDTRIALAKTELAAVINSNPGVAHPVGSCYGGGVVFYVNTTPGAPVGTQGLIAALGDLSSTSSWYTGNISTIVTSINLFTGASNTDAIVNQTYGNTSAAYQAKNYTDGVYHNWYLPSANEIAVLASLNNFNTSLFTHCGGTALSSGNSYWSSSQYSDNSNQAFFMNLNGDVYPADDFNPQYLIRAIRAF